MYIDPNTGGMLFQVLATMLAVISGLALLFSGKIRAWVARMRRTLRGKPAADDPDMTGDMAEFEETSREPEIKD
jgi:hypothetical protein